MADTPRNLRTLPTAAPSRQIDPDLRQACAEFRLLRLELYRSQLAAAIDLGKGRATIERIERCESDPPYSLICRMRRLCAERKRAA